MRAKMAGAFAWGFALGVLCLAVGLWSAGGLKTPALSAGNQEARAAPATALGEPAHAAPATAPNEPAPPRPAMASPDWTGEAERAAAETAGMPHLLMPVRGVSATHLADTFNDDRSGRKHEALDIPAPRGTPVVAAAEGAVVKLFLSKPGGLTVYQFDDSQTLCYYYAHLDRYAPALTEGTLLRRGDVLGYVGSTGNASPAAPHLHFAVFRLGPEKKWWQGEPMDPLPMLR